MRPCGPRYPVGHSGPRGRALQNTMFLKCRSFVVAPLESRHSCTLASGAHEPQHINRTDYQQPHNAARHDHEQQRSHKCASSAALEASLRHALNAPLQPAVRRSAGQAPAPKLECAEPSVHSHTRPCSMSHRCCTPHQDRRSRPLSATYTSPRGSFHPATFA